MAALKEDFRRQVYKGEAEQETEMKLAEQVTEMKLAEQVTEMKLAEQLTEMKLAELVTDLMKLAEQIKVCCNITSIMQFMYVLMSDCVPRSTQAK